MGEFCSGIIHNKIIYGPAQVNVDD
ncbi:uncharacterized protein G2W53_020477 [Senna tora]|uniref:Uncharacterized protein n=1 Tax=Senna tora TaxID=362788 RepID=A0A834TVX3_9FABA|nr:uncharacterized protein G2W53_020477 [Senna tora]